MFEAGSEFMQKIEALYAKPRSEKFNDEELCLIRKYMNAYRHKHVCRYAFYNKTSSSKRFIAFIIDTMYGSRRSGIENNWEYFVNRPISDIEFEELVQNFGCNHKRFFVYYYRDIEHLIKEDSMYNIVTPKSFIDECGLRGYAGNYQTKIDFE